MQSLPLDGLLIVTSPQELAVMVVKKAIKMARMLEVPILGLVENMSGLICPHCGKPVELFGPSRAQAVAAETGVRLLGTIPLDPELSRLGDRGEIEAYRVDFLKEIPRLLENN
jgi:Mrp family chromosome partitioning ATPase